MLYHFDQSSHHTSHPFIFDPEITFSRFLENVGKSRVGWIDSNTTVNELQVASGFPWINNWAPKHFSTTILNMNHWHHHDHHDDFHRQWFFFWNLLSMTWLKPPTLVFQCHNHQLRSTFTIMLSCHLQVHIEDEKSNNDSTVIVCKYPFFSPFFLLD